MSFRDSEGVTLRFEFRRFFEYLEIEEEHRRYIINQATRHCEIEEDSYFRPYEIPSNATFEGAYTIGYASEGFEVHEWSDRLPSASKSRFKTRARLRITIGNHVRNPTTIIIK